MRVVQFIQVVVLLLLIAYGVLVYLENPGLLRLPLLFAGRELVLPAGVALGLGVLVGALYAALLILPRYLRQRLLRRGDLLRRRDAETRLQSTLQAVVDGEARSEGAPPADPPPTDPDPALVPTAQPLTAQPLTVQPASAQPVQPAASFPPAAQV